MKHIYILLFAFLSSSLLTGCVEDPEMDSVIKNGGKPEITISSPTEFIKTARSVTLGGKVVSENGVPVVERGFCWGTKSIEENKQVVDKQGKGDFKATIDNLKNNTQYVICAYATTQNGKTETFYSPSVSFSTNEGLGSVKNAEPKAVRATTAVCGGKIADPGEGKILDQGIYLSTPTVKDSLVHGLLIGTDSIACLLTNLNPETTYSARVYVKNTYGTFSDVEPIRFTTTNGRPALTSLTKRDVRYTEADFSAIIKEDGDAPILTCGFCYSINEKELPTIANDTIVCKRIEHEFAGTLTNLKSQQVYYVRAYATNKFGTSYDSDTKATQLITKSNWPTVSTDAISVLAKGTVKVGGKVLAIGNSEITVVGVCWSLAPSPTVDNSIQDMTYKADSTFAGVISGLQGGKTYYLRAYAKNNEKEYAYGPEVSFTAPSVFKVATLFPGIKRLLGSPSACSLSGTGYLLGGDLGPNCSDELWAYNGSDSWNQRLSFPVEARKWQTVISKDNLLCVFGGVNKDGQMSNDLYAYNTINNSWSVQPTSGGPDGVARVAGCYKKESFYFIGGHRKVAKTQADSVTNEVWSYSFGWTKLAPFPQKQSGGIALVIGDVIYAGLGFIGTSADQSSKKLWASSEAMTWNTMADLPGSAIVRAGVAYGDCIYVVDDNGKIWKYETVANKWTAKSSLPSGNHAIHAMYVLDNTIYLLGADSKLTIYDPAWDN